MEENLRKIDDHVRRKSEQEGKVATEGGAVDEKDQEIEAARQLFVEQLEFLDKEK